MSSPILVAVVVLIVCAWAVTTWVTKSAKADQKIPYDPSQKGTPEYHVDSDPGDENKFI